LTQTIQFHENQNFSKKRHHRNVGGDTRHPETPQRSKRGRFRRTTPLAPINRRLPLLKFFTAPLLLLRIVTLFFVETRLVLQSSRPFNFLRTSLRYCSFRSLTLICSFYCIRFLYSANFIREHCPYFFFSVKLLNRWLESKASQDP
jgi:hypothetical protein